MPICKRCKQPVFYQAGLFAYQMGHIYSEAGKKEFNITGFCEWCFDEVTDTKIILELDAQD